MKSKAFIYCLGFVCFVFFGPGCSRKVAPPPDSLEGWRYIFSAHPDTTEGTPIDTLKLTPQRIDQ